MSQVDYPMSRDSKSEIKELLNYLPQSVIVCASFGLDLDKVAEIIEKYINPNVQFIKIESEQDSISIAQIKQLVTTSKYKKQRDEHHIFTVMNSDKMTVEAQNAFLKILEEPPDNTHFILVCHSPELLLDTVRSRSRVLNINEPDLSQVIEFFSDVEKSKVQELFSAFGGKVEYIKNALSQDLDSPNSLSMAKQFISGSPSQKILLIEQISADKLSVLEFLDALSLIIHILLRKKILKNSDSSKIIYESTKVDKILDIRNRLSANGNTKLNLSSLLLIV